MCNVCAMTQTFVPERHESGEVIFEGFLPLFSTLNEGTDASAGVSTSYTISAGDSFVGNVSTGGDVDWIAVTFEAGKSYDIKALGNDSGGGTLNDTDLRIYDSNGTFIEYDDFDGVGWDASITFDPTSTGTYYIAVSSYSTANTGTYTLTVDEGIAPHVAGTDGTVEQLAQYLREGASGFELKYNTTVSNQITVNLDGLTAAGQQLARWAMETWEMVADIDFVEVSSGEMITADDEDSGAFAYFPNSGSTAQGVELNVATSWLSSSGTKLDSYSFQTYIHEFGHAIGLNHQGNYNYTGLPITYENYATFANDSWQMSVMSYFSQTENTSINASFAYVTTAQIADIYAIQEFYGAPGASSATAGDTIFGLGSNLGNYLDDVFAAMATGQTTASIGRNRVAVTLYDQGGTDRLNLSYLASNKAARIDLNGGTFSDIGNDIGTLGIAVGTVIENLETGAGNDTIAGNEVGNIIISGAGDDTINGGGGADTLFGGTGADTLLGGAGDDLLTGGEGSDVFVVSLGMGDDLIQDFEDGVDTLDTSGVSGVTESSNGAGDRVLTLSDGSTVTLQGVPGVEGAQADDPLAVTISGIIREDDILQADVSGPAGLAEASPGDITYQWLRDGVNINGATSATYSLIQSDVGRIISVRVIFEGEEVVSAGTTAIENLNDAPTGTVVIVGKVAVNETLQANTASLTDEDGLGTFSYQWLRDGNAIYGAIGATYELTQTDVGAVISVAVSYTDAQGTAEHVVSEGTDVVLPLDVVSTGTPGDDVLIGAEGNDMLSGVDGNDHIEGAAGRDILNGGAGADTLLGGDGDDVLYGDGLQVGLVHEEGGQVWRVFQAGLGRTPDVVGHLHWTKRLVESELTLEQMSDAFVASAEFQFRFGSSSTAEFVNLTYNNALGRDADPNGLGTWIDRIDNQGWTKGRVLAAISESVENRVLSKKDVVDFLEANTDAVWSDDVFRLYQAVLGRTPDVGGFMTWTGQLGNGAELLDIATAFINSTEFQIRYASITTSNELVTQIYQNVLGRAPDPNGLTGWTNRLDNDGWTEAEVMLGFSQSFEFKNRTTADLNQWMRSLGTNDVLEGGAGDNVLVGGIMSDEFHFDASEQGTNTITDLEGWDTLVFNDFGYQSAADARAHMAQVGEDVVFEDQGVTITLQNTLLTDITGNMILLI